MHAVMKYMHAVMKQSQHVCSPQAMGYAMRRSVVCDPPGEQQTALQRKCCANAPTIQFANPTTTAWPCRFWCCVGEKCRNTKLQGAERVPSCRHLNAVMSLRTIASHALLHKTRFTA